MAGFRIWGRVEHVGPNEFFVVATAVPENGDPADVHTLTEIHASPESARHALEVVVIRVGAIIHRIGGTVCDVETGGL